MVDRIFDIGSDGLETANTKVRSLTNNLANAETAGFKSSDVSVKAFPLWLKEYETKLVGRSGTGLVPKIDGSFYDHSAGTLSRTGNDTDFAINGDGYFVVAAKWGDGYTRDGRFKLDVNGNLVSVAGNYPLMGQNGQISVVPGSKLTVTETGEIKVDGISIDRIRIVNFDNQNNLEAVSGAMFRYPRNKDINIVEIDSPRIVQGYIEGSNVNIINEMMDMIYLTRTYNIDTKVVQARDTALTSAISMGRVNQ